MVTILTILMFAAALAQAPVAAAQAAPPPPKPPSRANAVEHIKVHGKSLEGNLEGDSPDRDVTVYLPPSYASDKSRRYPVVYLLHGYGGRDDTFNGRLATLPDTADKLAASGAAKEMIVVTPSGFTLHKGSMYSNSPTTGDWESYIAVDLVAYMDSHYRTIPNRLSRGLGGHSMGGYGAVRIGMKQPDVIAKWAANAPLAMVGQYIPHLKMYKAIGMEVGTKDGLRASNKQLEEMFTNFGVKHTYEEYEGDHTNKVYERVETSVLPFFSKNLSFDAKATSATK